MDLVTDALLACDFMVAITVRFRILYILVVMEVGFRRILHCNVTDHPSAEWTIQQLREAIPSEMGRPWIPLKPW